MKAMAEGLSKQDVARLMSEPTPLRRAATASKIAAAYESEGLSTAEREIASEVFKALVKDAAEAVREALAQEIKASCDIPRDVALALANDVDAVSLPVLRESTVLSEEDLLEIVGTGSTARQSAVAQRAEVSEKLSDALIARGEESVVSKLVGNEGARISESGLVAVMETFGESGRVADVLSRRVRLPDGLADRLFWI